MVNSLLLRIGGGEYCVTCCVVTTGALTNFAGGKSWRLSQWRRLTLQTPIGGMKAWTRPVQSSDDVMRIDDRHKNLILFFYCLYARSMLFS